MISPFWYIGDKQSFSGSRETRIGSSEVPAIFVNPEKPTESLAGYDQTAITLYKKKTGEADPFQYNLAAEMGHFLENKAIELFIRRFSGKKTATEFIRKKIEYELLRDSGEDVKAEDYQIGLYRHNTEYFVDGMIAHCDCIYLGDESLIGKPKKERVITKEGITVDLSKPFYLEAKSARKEATKRQDGRYVKGYDFESTNWQGIPLKHFVQMQYQSSLLNIDVGYLPLLHNTSEFQIWRVDSDDVWKKRIINTVGKMLKHIEMRKIPKEMAICQADIISIYPNLRNDFVTLSGDALEMAKKACMEYVKADNQAKNWTDKKKDAQDAISVLLKDYDEIRDGSDILAKWQLRKGSESIVKIDPANKKDSLLVQLKKNDRNTYNYLDRKGYIKTGNSSRSVSIKFKGE